VQSKISKKKRRLDSPDALEQGEEENSDYIVREQGNQRV